MQFLKKKPREEMKTGAADAFSLIQSSFLLVIDGLVVDVPDCHVHDLVLL